MNIIYKPNNKSVANNDKRETINTRNLIAFRDDKFYNLATVRWYMGRSSSASKIYCTLWVMPHCMPIELNDSMCAGSGSAGGGGYCKQSAAFYDAMCNAGIKADQDVSGRGMSAVEDVLCDMARQAGFFNFTICRG